MAERDKQWLASLFGSSLNSAPGLAHPLRLGDGEEETWREREKGLIFQQSHCSYMLLVRIQCTNE